MEVKNSLFKMGAIKTAGPDDYLPILYQKFWVILGESLINFVRTSFSFSQFPRELNHSLISLIPKVENLESIKQIRPIALCNILIKVFKKVMEKFDATISSSQSMQFCSRSSGFR